MKKLSTKNSAIESKTVDPLVNELAKRRLMAYYQGRLDQMNQMIGDLMAERAELLVQVRELKVRAPAAASSPRRRT